MKDEMVDITKYAMGKIVDTLKDGDLLKDILDLSGDALEAGVPGAKLAYSVTNRFRIGKFKSFLLGYSKLTTSPEFSNAAELPDKLIKCSKEKVYQEFITSTYEAAIHAKSIRNTAVLGYFLGRTILMKKEITMDEVIISEALKNLTDLETSIFIDIFNKVNFGTYFHGDKIKDSIYRAYDIQLTIEGMKNLRLVAGSTGTRGDIETFGGCKFTQTTIEFNNVLYDSKIYREEMEKH